MNSAASVTGEYEASPPSTMLTTWGSEGSDNCVFVTCISLGLWRKWCFVTEFAKIFVDVWNEVDTASFNLRVVCCMIQKEFRQIRLKKAVQASVELCTYGVNTIDAEFIQCPDNWCSQTSTSIGSWKRCNYSRVLFGLQNKDDSLCLCRLWDWVCNTSSCEDWGVVPQDHRYE